MIFGESKVPSTSHLRPVFSSFWHTKSWQELKKTWQVFTKFPQKGGLPRNRRAPKLSTFRGAESTHVILWTKFSCENGTQPGSFRVGISPFLVHWCSVPHFFKRKSF